MFCRVGFHNEVALKLNGKKKENNSNNFSKSSSKLNPNLFTFFKRRIV